MSTLNKAYPTSVYNAVFHWYKSTVSLTVIGLRGSLRLTRYIKPGEFM